MGQVAFTFGLRQFFSRVFNACEGEVWAVAEHLTTFIGFSTVSAVTYYKSNNPFASVAQPLYVDC